MARASARLSRRVDGSIGDRVALQWAYLAQRSNLTVFSDFWTLVQLPAGVTLKRTILTWYIDNSGDINALEYWGAIPIVNTVEITFGDPPPFPENPGTAPLDGRDLLHLEITRMSNVNVGQGALASTASNQGSIGRIDTKVQRRNDATNASLYWSWGVIDNSPPAVAGSISRFAAAILVDGPDIP